LPPPTQAGQEAPKAAAALARERAARAIDKAVIARLDARSPRDATEAVGPTHWAGFRVVPGTEHPLDENARAGLATWLNASNGFNDRIVRRCARAHMVGLLLSAKSVAGTEGRTEVAVDFVCNAILVVSDDGQGRTLTSSFFDASRAPLLALIQKALPDDKELARLH